MQCTTAIEPKASTDFLFFSSPVVLAVVVIIITITNLALSSMFLSYCSFWSISYAGATESSKVHQNRYIN